MTQVVLEFRTPQDAYAFSVWFTLHQEQNYSGRILGTLVPSRIAGQRVLYGPESGLYFAETRERSS
jgi:hypothetical protein